MNSYYVPFPILKAIKKVIFVILLSSSFYAVFISSIEAKRRPLKYLFSFGNKRNRRGPGLGNTVAAAQFMYCFWPNIRANFCSSTNPGFSGGLLRANCASLAGILYWPYDPLARTHDARRPCNWRKLLSKPSFDRTWSAFFGLGSYGRFHWDDWVLVSIS